MNISFEDFQNSRSCLGYEVDLPDEDLVSSTKYGVLSLLAGGGKKFLRSNTQLDHVFILSDADESASWKTFERIGAAVVVGAGSSMSLHGTLAKQAISMPVLSGVLEDVLLGSAAQNFHREDVKVTSEEIRAKKRAQAIALLDAWLSDSTNKEADEESLKVTMTELDKAREGYRLLFGEK